MSVCDVSQRRHSPSPISDVTTCRMQLLAVLYRTGTNKDGYENFWGLSHRIEKTHVEMARRCTEWFTRGKNKESETKDKWQRTTASVVKDAKVSEDRRAKEHSTVRRNRHDELSVPIAFCTCLSSLSRACALAMTTDAECTIDIARLPHYWRVLSSGIQIHEVQ
jgi:hypothetical protein